MPPKPAPPEAAVIRRTAKRLARLDAERDEALAARRAAYAAGRDAGLSLRAMAELAGVTAEAVSQALKAHDAAAAPAGTG